MRHLPVIWLSYHSGQSKRCVNAHLNGGHEVFRLNRYLRHGCTGGI
jgi:hypothetical protein